MNLSSRKILNNGIEIPVMGLGVYKVQEGDEVEKAVKCALELGYRMVDTASIYRNEIGVGKAVKNSKIPREEIFITTKLHAPDQGYENTLKAIDVSLSKLDMSYVDLYLIHWPSASEDKFKMINKREETWRAMEEILKSGKAKAIGVSNYTIEYLEEMKKYAEVLPAVNQVEFHPFLYQEDLLQYCKDNEILLEAYSPLVKFRKVDNELIKNMEQKYDKTHGQILIRWGLQHGCIPIPKSIHRDRIKENSEVFNFEILEEDMKKINNLNENIHQAWNPEEIV
ncbi:MAG TPA: aldo/keto reductase [Candidatus Paceibacterota bacterium]|jgi:diketogulonate reductase-like aldo/keto reductase|nr:aldo/keto reductase [Candidatus Paceibacterota bacterium]